MQFSFTEMTVAARYGRCVIIGAVSIEAV